MKKGGATVDVDISGWSTSLEKAAEYMKATLGGTGITSKALEKELLKAAKAMSGFSTKESMKHWLLGADDDVRFDLHFMGKGKNYYAKGSPLTRDEANLCVDCGGEVISSMIPGTSYIKYMCEGCGRAEVSS